MSQNGSRRSDETFAQGLTTHGSRLLRIAYRILGDLHWAEDAVAETYLKAWQKRRTLRDDAKVGPWLSTVCRRQAWELQRKVRRSPAQRLPQEVPDRGTPSPEGRGDAGAYRAQLLGRLPKELRVCASMSFVEGRGYAEIATLTGLPLSTVRGRIFLSRGRLRKEIQMNSEVASHQADFSVPKLAARGDVVEWRGCKVRFLGVGWTGAETLYKADGMRLSRIPAALTKSTWLQPEPLRAGGYEGPTVSYYWQATGSPLPDVGATAFDVTGVVCMPSTGVAEVVGRAKLLRHTCAPPARTDKGVRVSTLLLGKEDRTKERGFRVVLEDTGFKLTDWGSITKPDWGVLFLFGGKSGSQEGTAELSLALSSAVAEPGCSLFGLAEPGREVRARKLLGGEGSCPDGHLHAGTYEFAIPLNEVKGFVIYPRHRVLIDWGRVKVPPRPKGDERS